MNDCFYIYISSKQKDARRKYKMARVLISMPEDFLNKIDKMADSENRSRSELIREALRTYMGKQKIRNNTLAIKNASTLESLLAE